MNLASRRVRLKAIWLLLLPFLYLARPRPELLVAGGFTATLGGGLRAWAAGCIRKDRELATTGPYAHIRNPLYLGSLLIGVGITVAGGRPIFVALFLLFFGVVYLRTVGDEEAGLAETFGDTYRHYRSRVPRFVPRLTPYRRPTTVPAGGGEPGSGGDAGAPASPASTPDGGFSPAQYLRNREWEAGLGLLAGFGFLVVKMIWSG